MPRHRRLVTIAAAVLLAATAAPAAADVRVVHDPERDGTSDIVRVRVGHTDGSLKLKIKVRTEDEFAHFYDVWVDTDPEDPGPEFVISSAFEVLPRVFVSPADDFGDLSGDTRCTVRTAKAQFGKLAYRFSVPRRCLATDGERPEQLRVSVEASDEFGRHDWVPDVRTFSRWVASG